MRRWIACAFGLALAAGVIGLLMPPSRADQAYVGGVDDLPLMPGLVEDTQSNLVFDSPVGRIVEAYATGRVRVEGVEQFYEETLPQLGWVRIGANQYRRESDVLEIEALPEVTDSRRVTVRFSLSSGLGNAGR
jgi:hypothetical protein